MNTSVTIIGSMKAHGYQKSSLKTFLKNISEHGPEAFKKEKQIQFYDGRLIFFFFKFLFNNLSDKVS